MSALHLEFCDNGRWLKHNKLPVTGDVLVLAGDIFYLKNKIAPLSNFWKWASANYCQVLIVPGNHEYYNYCDVMDNEYFMVSNLSCRRIFCMEGYERFPADNV